MVSRKTKPAPPALDERAQAKLRAALHEAGRFIAAKHFGVAEVSGLHPVGAGQFAGKTLYGSTSSFNEAVIGWCGPLAEMMLGRSFEKWQADGKAVWQMYAENQLTKADTDLINRNSDKRKAFTKAVDIISDGFGEVTQAAVNLFKSDSLFNFP